MTNPRTSRRSPTLRLGVIALAALAAAGGAGCSRSTKVQVAPADLILVRTYGFDSTVADPQPAWSPTGNRIVVRAAGGFALLEEGVGKQDYFTATTQKDCYHPAWIDARRFVHGPASNILALADGRVVPTTEGITLVTIPEHLQPERKALANWGYRPRVGDFGRGRSRSVVVQVVDKIVVLDPDTGESTDFADGFYAEPQPDGPGIAWQETPVFEEDRWTAKNQRRGRLVVRWKPGVTSTVMGGVQPRWTSDGGVVCTVMRDEPGPKADWWSKGTDVVFVAGPDAEPVVIAKDARDPAPHPRWTITAVTRSSGGLGLAGRSGGVLALADLNAQTADIGTQPAWNADGLRLVAVEPGQGAVTAMLGSRKDAKPSPQAFLRVYVFGLPQAHAGGGKP